MNLFKTEKTGLELLKEKIEESNRCMVEAVEDMRKARDKMAKNQEVLNELFKFIRDLQQAEIEQRERGF